MSNENTRRYDDIIHLPHPEPTTRPRMAMENRAAQFSPFAALTGFGAAINEAGRETEEKLELSEDTIDMINARLAVIGQHIKEKPSVAVTYFLPDKKKPGGKYVTVSGNVEKLDGMKCAIIMTNGTKIPIGDVRYIDGDMFRLFE